ncbi:MAG: M18 family aminopeptidase [Pseudomonadales bacterium]|nr:M18 family aminopeptidase [Pseudomonadales bacterium]
MSLSSFNQGVIDFIQQSPTPFHATQTMASMLSEAGFVALDESASWSLVSGGRYFVCRNDSSIIAFKLGKAALPEAGFSMVGAHTDSPCLKVKPEPTITSKGYLQLGVEVYGGALLNPWFDRDLSLAGRVSYRTENGVLKSALVNFEKPIAVIPSLAIHLDRNANKDRTINPQKDIPPVLALVEDEQFDLNVLLKEQMANQGHRDVDVVLAHELFFYDTQAPRKIGLKDEFIAAARLDNLLSCYIGLQALLNAEGDKPALLVCNDHEEVGSTSACGAQGPFLMSVLERLCPHPEDRLRCIQASVFVSADNAHGVHPNFADKHDGNHGPILNQGPVVKINANQRYASNSETVALFRHIAEQENVPLQSFVVRTDLGCGSTIGPITAAGLGIKTIDVGVPTFGMHSIRELAGSKDGYSLYQILKSLYSKGCA